LKLYGLSFRISAARHLGKLSKNRFNKNKKRIFSYK
jgi:hypothetical protein